ncbi:MAG: peptidoglycan DD-metalloendopeptidase family protein [Syntrophales bacterium]|nr:peptidoglycan DD-metalloendopeptidase family protein [Syntrophales bacterium]MDD5641088.1 peptidoglycan DD-metalloendopeptidase family protein [Syntrophales bacterium]
MNATGFNSNFWQHLLINNRENLPGFKRWVFSSGMLFNSLEKWWGDEKSRPGAHQGIDLCFFEDNASHVNNVDITLKIPAAFSGKIVKIGKDFLGRSIYISHHIYSDDHRQLYSVFGHTNPFPAVSVGKKVAEGEPIAWIARVPQEANILPHLHITFAWIPVSFNPEHLNWRNLANDPLVTLIDPFSVLSIPG